jgi:hypothetical protein
MDCATSFSLGLEVAEVRSDSERGAAEEIDGDGARRVQALPPHRIIELGFWGGGGGFLIAGRIRGSGGTGRTGGGVVRW